MESGVTYLTGKHVSITYKDGAKYRDMVNQGICVYDCNEMIGIRCDFSKQVTFISKSIIEIMNVE